MKYGHLKVPETCYLATDVGANVLKNESQMLNTVGLEEAVDLRLAEHREAGENMASEGLLTKSEPLL